MEKENTELTPVYFSDFRIEKGVTPDKYPVSHTFFGSSVKCVDAYHAVHIVLI